jgi:hypothetical protein
MGVVCMLIVSVTRSRWLNLIVGVPVGALVFYGTASALRIPELAAVRETVLKKLRP